MNSNFWRKTPPYNQQFLFCVNKDFEDKTLLEFYTTKFKYKSQSYWQSLIDSNCVSINHQRATPETILKFGDEIRTQRKDVVEPDVNAEIEILFHDQNVFVLNKKAPIPVHPSGRYFKNSLTTVLREHFPETTFHTIHRLDKWTTGVLILATEAKAAQCLHKQVEKQLMKKMYGVIACGEFLQKQFTISESIGRVQGSYRGTGQNVHNAKESETQFEVMQTQTHNPKLHLLKAIPITGRTNQIRVHVQACGGYVLNDPLYSPMKKNEDEMIPFLGLHCREMTFNLPDGKAISIQAPWPDEFLELFPNIDF